MEDIEYWKERWKNGQIKYHLADVHPSLKNNIERFPDENTYPPKNKVLVPFCGKSKDLLFLFQNGYFVIGIEVSTIAIESFFEENQLTFKKEDVNGFIAYKHDERLIVFEGDLFKITPNVIGGQCTLHWDRGGLVALEECFQKRYIDQLKVLLCDDSVSLLESFEYTVQHSGPPRAIFISQLKSLFGTEFLFEEISRIYSLDMPSYVNKYKDFYHVLYLIKRCKK